MTDHPPIEILRIDDDALPELRSVVEHARAVLTSEAITLVCPHMPDLAAIGCPAIACAGHPGAGLMCPDCVGAHNARHPSEFEFKCDVCGTVDDGIVGLFAELLVTVAVTTLVGAKGFYLGVVVVGGIGVCPACSVAADLPGVTT